ncbi:hypothetical protein TIFTF001_025437 [Ficus carica]|uniref:NB-ARC domain-containing protein n=1 Tax=Ficus carica TaxID=3494 RepID=A0AA88AR41_FICCA|nr:hypothetical protein TIFTF001_025437 [Ficus carica]
MQVGFQAEQERILRKEIIPMKELLEERRNRRETLKGLEDHDLVESIKTMLFRRGSREAKFYFTTRNETVASSADPRCFPIKPPLLTPGERAGSFLSELGKEMVVKCGGLPLAIVVLASLLSTKLNSLHQSEKLQKDVKTLVINKLKSEQHNRVEDILDLSFQHLP